MLMLNRKAGQEVFILVPPSTEPTLVRVVQVRIDGNRSHLGFEAPRQVEIARDDAKSQANKEFANLVA